jgi:phosphoglycerol transferase MdoB-like AlkP superfamily enzyme
MTPLRERCLSIIDPYKTTLFVVALMGTLYYIWLMDYLFLFPKESPSWLWLQLFLFTLTLFNCRNWKLATLVWLAVSLLILYANKIKCDVLLFPITETDLKILANNPVGFLDAAGISRPYQYVGAAALVGAGGYLAQKLFRILRRQSNRNRFLAEFAMVALFVVFSFKILAHFYRNYGNFIFENRNKILEMGTIWSPEGMVTASKQLSAIGFLSYTHSAASKTEYGIINRIAPAYRAADQQTVHDVAAKYLPPAGAGRRQLPNIVFILAESAFNPNTAFRLDREVTNSLFTTTEEEAGGELHVSAVGGGTWKTEFETITGIDSRLFGFAGEYTHVSLSPFIRQSFATYLQGKGYDTRAYYPVRGIFYGAKTAYLNYGFNRFDDATDLHLELDWSKFSDEELAEKVLSRLQGSQDKPLFTYLLTLQAHSPYYCTHFNSASTFPVQLAGDGNFSKNCKLNEFLLKIAATERAVDRIVAGLRALEQKTGRPFLVVVFGDHQPHDLTNDSFNRNRRDPSPNHTFYKIVKSESITLPSLEGEFHATLIPTLVSTAVADRADQLYLPENFYVYDRCGAVTDLGTCADLSVLTRAYREYLKGEWFK